MYLIISNLQNNRTSVSTFECDTQSTPIPNTHIFQDMATLTLYYLLKLKQYGSSISSNYHGYFMDENEKRY